MEDSSILILLFIIFSVGSLFRKYYLPKIKGAKGENRVNNQLWRLKAKDYKVYNDLYLESNGRSTQIDHLVISVYGVFVIETKNYAGWIHGHEKAEYWTQTFYKKKQKFRNPIKQNWAHIYFLKEILSDLAPITFHSIIVFAGKAKLKNIESTIPVIYKHQLLKTIKQNKEAVLSMDQAMEIISRIDKFTTSDTKTRKRHEKLVNKNVRERKQNVKNRICPNCKSELVLRNGKYGKFYGCSNYPACRFTAKV